MVDFPVEKYPLSYLSQTKFYLIENEMFLNAFILTNMAL